MTWLFWIALLAVTVAFVPPEGGWLDWIRTCPLWHEPEEKE